MEKEEKKINAEMTIAEILKMKPEAGAILMAKGMHCLGCIIAQGETLAQAAEVHGIPVEELLIELNK
ncbi:MAG: DUF1858 domain-containing protein [Candidatus Methanomethylicaceae archaeon]